MFHTFDVEEPSAGQAPRRSRSVLAVFLVLGLVGTACLFGAGLPATGALQALSARADVAQKPAMVANRGGAPVMDETVFQKALAGELEEEGFENHWMSEAGWAEWLDKNAESSYNMNQRPSKIGNENYFTPDAFSNPLDVITKYLTGIKEASGRPLDVAFPTISNDVTGARSFPKGSSEIDARTIKPKIKNFDKDMRITGIPGYNVFGAPGSKSDIPTVGGKEGGFSLFGDNNKDPNNPKDEPKGFFASLNEPVSFPKKNQKADSKEGGFQLPENPFSGKDDSKEGGFQLPFFGKDDSKEQDSKEGGFKLPFL